ncbi:hypothetical protein TW86_03750 [Halomonas sp. S2151]|uniref:hypothetical protein n=1 Tax=Halomonas sp. S2151 TaxID=579478 RepID=UPI0005FA407A|nr:hypothetical protein [Halomonas sp. S2151]KJZ17380.1 hypothetical protein TW86_03750 [Halomonas sp. S2151]
MATAEQHIPTVEEELERKAMNELSRILHLFETGRITHREMNLMLDTLWNCVSGLTGEDWREMIEMARQVEDDQPSWRYVGIEPDQLRLAVAWRSEEALELVLRDRHMNIVKRLHKNFADEERASVKTQQTWAKTLAALSDKGFRPL